MFLKKNVYYRVKYILLVYILAIFVYSIIHPVSHGVGMYSILYGKENPFSLEDLTSNYWGMLLSIWAVVMFKVLLLFLLGVLFVIIVYNGKSSIYRINPKSIFAYFLNLRTFEKMGFFIFIFLSVFDIYSSFVFSKYIIFSVS